MLSANFKPKSTAAASRGFLATAWLSCTTLFFHVAFSNLLRQLCWSRLAFIKTFRVIYLFDLTFDQPKLESPKEGCRGATLKYFLLVNNHIR